MPRYFFDMRDNLGIIADDEGIELPTFAAVQEEAARSLADFMRDEIRRIRVGPALACELIIEVRDELGPFLHAKFSFEVKRVH